MSLADMEWEAYGDEGLESDLVNFNDFFGNSDDEEEEDPNIPENPDPVDEPIYPSVNETDRIIGGGNADRGEYPFAARLEGSTG